jgi:hypothetical protein
MLTKLDKLETIIKNYKFNKKVVDVISDLYNNFDELKYLYFRNIVN